MLFSYEFWLIVALVLVVAELMTLIILFGGMAGGALVCAITLMFFEDFFRQSENGMGMIVALYAVSSALMIAIFYRFIGTSILRTYWVEGKGKDKGKTSQSTLDVNEEPYKGDKE